MTRRRWRRSMIPDGRNATPAEVRLAGCARTAERNLLAKARAWFAASDRAGRGEIDVSSFASIRRFAAAEAARDHAFGKFILACGLDLEARNDLRNATRRATIAYNRRRRS